MVVHADDVHVHNKDRFELWSANSAAIGRVLAIDFYINSGM